MKQTFYLKGFNCATCALKLQDTLNDTPGFDHVSVNLNVQKLTFSAEQAYAVSDIQAIVDGIESGVRVQRQRPETDEPDHAGNLLFLLPAIALYAAALAVPALLWKNILFVAAYLLAGHSVLWRALRNLQNGRLFDENFLMSLATAGAFALNEFPEAAAVMIFYQIGEYFQGRAVGRSRRAIADMMDLRVETVHRLTGGVADEIPPEAVAAGDRLLVKPGEKIAVDGTVRSGVSYLQTAAITGEPVPRKAGPGDTVLSGFINGDGTLEIEADKPYRESTVAKILELVENASGRKAKTELFITRFARVYTPIVVLIALLLAVLPPLVSGQPFDEWIYRALVFLVISCPCALVLSVPLSYFAGLGAASRHGLVIKGGNYLEVLEHADRLVLDKTGTITEGKFEVRRVQPADGVGEAELLTAAVRAESQSNHPIATSILTHNGGRRADPVATREYSGEGIVTADGIAAGNAKLMKRRGIDVGENDARGTLVYVAEHDRYLGSILISDRVKPAVRETIAGLKANGISRVAMLTGDRLSVAQAIAEDTGIDDVHAELLPQDKVAVMEQIKSRHPSSSVIFVGDGTNDAPVLASADVGIAMGDIGSDAALEAADMVLMRGRLTDLLTGMRIAKRTKRIVWQNIVLSLGTKLLVLTLGAFGAASMWTAIFADVGIALIAVLNALRILRTVPVDATAAKSVSPEPA